MRRWVALALLALAAAAFLLFRRPATAPSPPAPAPARGPVEPPATRDAVEPAAQAHPMVLPAKLALSPIDRLLAALRNRDMKAIAQANAALYAELVPEPIPDDENGAALYKQAFEKLVKPTEAERAAIDEAEPMTPERRAILQAYLEKNKEALALLHEAAGRPRCAFPVAFNEGFEALLPHVSPTIQASRLLKAEGILAEDGNLAAVAVAALRAAEALGGEPVMVSQLVMGVNHAMASDTLQRALASAGGTGALEAAIESLAPEEGRAATERSVLLELWTGVQLYLSGRDLASLGARSEGVPSRPWSEEPDSALDLLYYAETIVEYGGLLRQPYYESREAIDRLMRTRVEGMPAYAHYTRLALPSFDRAASRFARAEATLGMARAAVALNRFRATQGAYPGALSALGPSARLIDPFTGRAYGYRPEGTGFVLYSVGEDGIDSGGLSESNDLIFRVAPR